MKRTLAEVVVKATRLVAFSLFVIFGATMTSCTDEHFLEMEESTDITTGVDFSDLKFNHQDWTIGEGIATSQAYYDGYAVITKNGESSTAFFDHQIVPMTLSWTPMEETTSGAAQRQYLGSKAGNEKVIKTTDNQGINLVKYERECKLNFVGAELNIKGSWYKATLWEKDGAYCRYDSTSVATQVSDTAMVNGTKIVVEKDGAKYNRVNVTVHAVNYFTDMPAKVAHKEQMELTYSTLVPVIPGAKVYEGSTAVEGTGAYAKVTETTYKSTLTLNHLYTQDGVQTSEQETVSGVANIKTWVEEQGEKMIVDNIEIGNPTVSIENTTSEMYQKQGYIYAVKHTTVWTYTWSNGFTKKVYAEVERLYYMREEGKAVAMPYGETTTSFKSFVAGTTTEKSENGNKYDAYASTINFNGNHKSETGSVNNAISGLTVGQEFWVKNDTFLSFDKQIIPGNATTDAQIIITEHWSVSGDKVIKFTQKGAYTFSVSEQQRVLGENLTFVSGLNKSTDNQKYSEVKDNQFSRTVTTTYVAKFNLCEVKAIATATEAYIEYRGEKINFQFATADVEYKGLNNPTATEVTVDGNDYSRKNYSVTFNHTIVGDKAATVLVDKLIIKNPDMPDEIGAVDIEKTRNFGGLSWSWDASGKPFVSGTIVTENGVVSFWNGGYSFHKMTTNEITARLGNSLYPENNNQYLIPAYISIQSKPNKHWLYTDVNGKARDEVYGTLIMKLEDVKLDEPFFGIPSETSETFRITNQDGSVRIKVVYKGSVVFDHVFAN